MAFPESARSMGLPRRPPSQCYRRRWHFGRQLRRRWALARRSAWETQLSAALPPLSAMRRPGLAPVQAACPDPALSMGLPRRPPSQCYRRRWHFGGQLRRRCAVADRSAREFQLSAPPPPLLVMRQRGLAPVQPAFPESALSIGLPGRPPSQCYRRRWHFGRQLRRRCAVADRSAREFQLSAPPPPLLVMRQRGLAPVQPAFPESALSLGLPGRLPSRCYRRRWHFGRQLRRRYAVADRSAWETQLSAPLPPLLVMRQRGLAPVQPAFPESALSLGLPGRLPSRCYRRRWHFGGRVRRRRAEANRAAREFQLSAVLPLLLAMWRPGLAPVHYGGQGGAKTGGVGAGQRPGL